jgi:hypothetical protein
MIKTKSVFSPLDPRKDGLRILATLKAMTMCCLPSINTMQVDGRIQVAVTCDPLDLLNFLKRDFLPMNLLCARAGMFEERIYDRTKAVFEYFNLPFAAEPLPKNRFE